MHFVLFVIIFWWLAMIGAGVKGAILAAVVAVILFLAPGIIGWLFPYQRAGWETEVRKKGNKWMPRWNPENRAAQTERGLREFRISQRRHR